MISQKAQLALLYEVSASPKPGLVDRFNSGAHKDMDFYTFMASSAALGSYFEICAAEGMKFEGGHPRKLFQALRDIGRQAEKTMFEATGGVNTHRGLIFSLGMICAAASNYMKEKRTGEADIEAICQKVSMMAEGLCLRELEGMKKVEGLTCGERLYRKYGFKGIRGEVESGFLTVRNYALPPLQQLKSVGACSMNDRYVQTLLHLMAVNEDTNIAARFDAEKLEYVRRYARAVLNAGGMLTSRGVEMVYKMDRKFIRENISPGGSADLLAVAIMLDLLSEG
ncbi:MAG: 2-(5'-triphosphoribosyl)-3'-dephospho CoA synthase [Clostridia bacterium BRH_c25]|nr:MAG: 2-(5'-triphosphoribosyl)-3'-dephospho CoA synthase [Clostridia bacterium BRH_c25]